MYCHIILYHGGSTCVMPHNSVHFPGIRCYTVGHFWNFQCYSHSNIYFLIQVFTTLSLKKCFLRTLFLTFLQLWPLVLDYLLTSENCSILISSWSSKTSNVVIISPLTVFFFLPEWVDRKLSSYSRSLFHLDLLLFLLSSFGPFPAVLCDSSGEETRPFWNIPV